MRKGHVKISKTEQKELYPLHLLVSKLAPCVVDNLPAGHSLTSCDTVAKVGTKLSLLKLLESDSDLIQGFGSDRLDEDTSDQAEQFLVKVVATKTYMSCQTFDELRTKLYRHSRKRNLYSYHARQMKCNKTLKELTYKQECGWSHLSEM